MGFFTTSEEEKAQEEREIKENLRRQTALKSAQQKAIWVFDGNTDALNYDLADGWEFLSACPTPCAAGGETYTVKNHACLVILKRISK